MSRVHWDREGRDWPNRDASRFVRAAGLTWHVQQMGEGPPLLLLHGTGAATHSWRDLMPLLAPHFTCVAPDLPGHGFTTGQRSHHTTLPGMARALAALLEEVGVAPAYAAGHSAGAAVAIRMTLDRLIAPAAIAAINGALLPFPGIAARLFPALAKLLFLNPLVPSLLAQRARQAGEVERFLPRATGSHIDARGNDLYGRLFATSDHCAAALSMMANWELEPFAEDLPLLKARLLLLHGEADSAVPAWVSRDVALMVGGSEAIALPDLGHLAHEEAPEQVARLLIDRFKGEERT